MGKVKIMSKGFTIAFSIANTSAKMMAVVKEFIEICGSNNLDKIYTASAVTNKFIINRMVIDFPKATLNYNQFKKIFLY